MADGPHQVTDVSQTPNADKSKRGSETAGDKLRASRGKQPRSPAKAPKRVLSGKGCGVAQTTRRLAWKQPPLKECVIAHWSSDSAPTI